MYRLIFRHTFLHLMRLGDLIPGCCWVGLMGRGGWRVRGGRGGIWRLRASSQPSLLQRAWLLSQDVRWCLTGGGSGVFQLALCCPTTPCRAADLHYKNEELWEVRHYGIHTPIHVHCSYCDPHISERPTTCFCLMRPVRDKRLRLGFPPNSVPSAVTPNGF